MKTILLFTLLYLPTIVTAQSNICKDLESEYDDLRETTRILSPVLEPVCFYKIKGKERTTTYIVLKATGETITISAKGVILLFADGTRWEKPEAVAKAKVKDLGTYQYTALIELTNEEIDMFKQKQIRKFGLYVYNTELNSKEAERYTSYAACIKEM